MIWLGVSLVIQIMFVLHAHRTGRDQIWMWVIMLFSIPGCFAYFVFEMLPEMIGPDSPMARKKARKLEADPARRLREAEAALAQVETAANRIALGDAQAELGAHSEAAEQYRRALDVLHARDAKIEAKLARALFASGDYREAIRQVDQTLPDVSAAEGDRLLLIKARALAACDQAEEAVSLFQQVVPRIASDEARCHYAAVLIGMDRRREAREWLAQAVANGKARQARWSGDEAAMYQWAEAALRD